ncbi:MAG TPA: CopG family transcriptional regulator [Trueperaceae bacterium]
MRRTQIYITAEQSRKIRELARRRGVSQAQVIRQVLDAGLETGDPEAEARAAILATAGILADAPEWPEWQASVRGRTADERLTDQGL